MTGIKDIVLELARDIKSRKFLLTIGAFALVVGNKYFDLDLSILELVIAISPAAIFIIMEGIADIRER